jgi:hypothetical protein
MEDRLRCVLNSQAVFFPAFTLVHRAFCAAAFFLRAAAESVLLRTGTTVSDLTAFDLNYCPPRSLGCCDPRPR